MALPMLMGGAECGPSNPLQGLAKRFDADRGLQQDHFGVGRAGSSRETFRTEHSGTPGFNQDAANFFNSSSARQSPALNGYVASAFDLSGLHRSLPMQAVHQPQPLQQQNPMAAWAVDFMQQQPALVSKPDLQRQMQPPNQQMQVHQDTMYMPQTVVGLPQTNMQWTPGFNQFQPAPTFAPITIQQQNLPIHTGPMERILDMQFLAHATSMAHSIELHAPEVEIQVQPDHQLQITPQEQDDIARTAGLLVHNLRDEQNPKFQNSVFMGLMKQLRDRELVVDANDIVHASEVVNMNTDSQATFFDNTQATLQRMRGASPSARFTGLPVVTDVVSEAWKVDVKGKGRAIDAQEDVLRTEEDPNDAYFRQENEEFARYWEHMDHEQGQTEMTKASVGQTEDWHRLQEDWEQFEATSVGIKPVDIYQFQTSNPYLLGDSSRTNTRTHALHAGGYHQSFLESVLEMEATVQRDPESASAWYELGVKQQENEREQKAIQALQRAIELDPSQLPAYLALAVSYTNNSDRKACYNVTWDWVRRNTRYAGAVDAFLKTSPEPVEGDGVSDRSRFAWLIDCLISLARSDGSGEVDADVQIALAVLLNTNEEYTKAQDCFQTALAVRPDDWLLYNRVGATLANNGHSEEALPYYIRALELNPAYIRARYNLGISQMNLKQFKEAAEQIVHALTLQESDSVGSDPSDGQRGVTSNALWDSLKSCCIQMKRIELSALCEQRSLDGIRAALQQL